MSSEHERLLDAIQGIIGTAPFVLVWDCTPMSDLVDDTRDQVTYLCPPHQASYTSQGLCQAGVQAWGRRGDLDRE